VPTKTTQSLKPRYMDPIHKL